MNFLKKLASFFTGGGGGGGGSNRAFPIYVFSNRCREPIMAEIDLVNSLSRDEDNQFYSRKVLQGSGRNRWFTQVEVEIWFDRSKKVSRYDVSGGRWLTEEEYEEELIRFDAPPEGEDTAADDDSQSG